MKKLIVLAAFIFIAAAASTAFAGNKKKNKKQDKKTLVLKNRADSVSYACGMSVTQGLMDFLVQGMKVDTAYMSDVLRGFSEAVSASGEQKARIDAYKAGAQVAEMLNGRIIPGVSKDLEHTRDSVIDRNLLIEGFAASLRGDASIFSQEAAETYFTEIRNKDVAEKEEKIYGQNRIAGEEFLKENAAKPGVVTLDNGLQYKVLTKGTGAVPTMNDNVVVKYEGRLINGQVFDSSYKRNPQTNTFKPTDVIKGWTQVLTMMPVGSKWEVYIPQELAYGSRNAGMIKPFSALVFVVELVDIKK